MPEEPLTVPEWVCTLVGKLALDNEALRQQILQLEQKSDDKSQ